MLVKMVSHILLSLILFSVLLTHEALAFSGGAPPSTCVTLEPAQLNSPSGHGNQTLPQTTTVPYMINLQKTTIKGDTHEIEGHKHVMMALQLKEGEKKEFKGFMVWVKKKGSEMDPVTIFHGTWKNLIGGQADTVRCDQNPNFKGSAWTHSTADPKKITQVYWKPDNENGEYEVHFTVVQSLAVYWTKQQTAGHFKIQVIKTDKKDEVITTTTAKPNHKIKSNGFLAASPNPVTIAILLMNILMVSFNKELKCLHNMHVIFVY